MARPKAQIQKFIDDIKKDEEDSFTYEMYKNWCNNNDEEPIQQERFNAIIFSNFGFAWNINQGFLLKEK